jgi:site-specific DNA-methyltransferase (adenine-specific)
MNTVSLFQPSPTHSGDGWSLYRQDAVEWLRSCASESIDLCVTDPAYESLEKHRAVGTTTRLKHSKASSNEWFPIFPNARYPELFRELHRVMKRDTHVYVMCDSETLFVIKSIAEAAGFRFWKPLIFDKRKIGMGYHYRSRYEFVAFFEKGHRNLNDRSIPDVLEVPSIRSKTAYPTEKPERLYEILIEQSSRPGETVLDAFCGSGAGGGAALKLGRRFIGLDVSDAAMVRSRERLGE